MTDKVYKVGVLTDWCPSDRYMKEWMAKMSEQTDECRTRGIQIVSETKNDQDADYFIIFNRPMFGEYYDPKRTVVVPLEPKCSNPYQTWGTKTWGEWAKPDPSKFLQVRNHETYVNLFNWELKKNIHELRSETIQKKSDGAPVSTAMSHKYFDPGHIMRVDFLKHIDNITPNVVDIYGYTNSFDFKAYKGPHAKGNKNETMLPYKYYFHVENNQEYNFITEKIWDSVLAECVCFYLGCPNITDYIDPACFILLDQSDHEKNYQIMKKAIENNEWEKRIDRIREQKRKLLRKDSPYNIFNIMEAVIQSEKETPIDIFIHACSVGYGMNILNEQINRIKNTLLYTRCRMIYIFIVGPEYQPLDNFQSNKIKVKHLSLNMKDCEYVTMTEILDKHIEKNQYVLYFHTKGVTHPDNKKSKDWRGFMEYAVIDNYAACIKYLDNGYTTVGCNLNIQPSPNQVPTHFSGNFWWATGEYILKNKSRYGRDMYKYDQEQGYIKTDDPIDIRTFPSVEFWIASHPEAKNKCIAHSHLNHYVSEFDSSIYTKLVDDQISKNVDQFILEPVSINMKCIGNLSKQLFV